VENQPFNIQQTRIVITIPDDVDIVVTHGPAKYILDDNKEGTSCGCEHLRRALCRSKPKLHCFGHVHHSYGAQRLVYPEEAAHPDAEDDGLFFYPKEFVVKNQAKKKGYASLSPGSAEAIFGENCLAVNAAIDFCKEPNAPWVVELKF
jgi:hypothetical protein